MYSTAIAVRVDLLNIISIEFIDDNQYPGTTWVNITLFEEISTMRKGLYDDNATRDKIGV